MKDMKLHFKRVRPTNYIGWAAFIFLVILLVAFVAFIGSAIQFIFGKTTQETYSGIFAYVTVTGGFALTVLAKRDSMLNNIQTGPEGYRPSRLLDKVIHRCYVKRCYQLDLPVQLNSKAMFTTYLGDTDVLRALEPNAFSYELNAGTLLYNVRYKYQGKTYEAISGSLQMAICTAFLRSFGPEDIILTKRNPF